MNMLDYVRLFENPKSKTIHVVLYGTPLTECGRWVQDLGLVEGRTVPRVYAEKLATCGRCLSIIRGQLSRMATRRP